MIKLPKNLQRLEHFLLSPAVSEEGMLLTELDGFLAAIAVCPEQIPEPEWMLKIWGEEEPKFGSKAEKDSYFATVRDRYAETEATMKNDKYDPILEPDNDGSVLWEGWVAGFKQAVMLRPASWLIHDKASDGDARLAFSLLMRLAELEENDTEPQEGDEALERDALLLIPHCAHKLYKAKAKLFEPRISTSSSSIVGRNDPCPCGSGKKFKKCCLN